MLKKLEHHVRVEILVPRHRPESPGGAVALSLHPLPGLGLKV